MRGSRQFTQSGQARDNAILQGLIAQGYTPDHAARIAASEAAPSEYDRAFGKAIIWFWWVPSIALVLVLWIVAVVSLHT